MTVASLRRLPPCLIHQCRRGHRAGRSSAEACDGYLLRRFALLLLRSPNALVCGVPPEYCEYGPKETYEKCKEWTLKNCPELVPQLKEQAEKAEAERKAKAEAAAAAAKAEGKDAPAEGEAPAAAAKPKKKKKVASLCSSCVCTCLSLRCRRSPSSPYRSRASTAASTSSSPPSLASRTLVLSLFVSVKRRPHGATAGVKLPEASKMFGKRFACGCSVIKLPTGGEEINIQGARLGYCALAAD